ncbi:rfaE bifunctional protein nucleotidyltransferase chain/domain/rfaE bifunctional protein kinase chain/domain [Streptosporangium becharense]|uniref:D-glycero-beta-D-manno-heptose 1-phosphate adenylyltransferase n=1 Tax=Streptosporangium becharense TaxID=1816182 RepID=A0A7W9IEC7_9ACTN|nr:D-glycero-beta-D-manno-heptose 1-phosphate adenylyltransferase [Streptosporangium becharense]MBB2912042.1 rfaE bifunctional protein nucleotidyltransferase chain/domain/rfaE bifunctional protein kinase chain/domain [Streptosporangium becharense]MBB5818589.1 rfaE bifunctional protein nucleotidyltransferase chain/domain/rfaE bifunctional protein kinase chain/domain [Streptosporangium becharense]
MSGAGPMVVIGDALLDVDVEGDADRLCPDAPVPVVAGGREFRRPGGAGLAAVLAAGDGAEVVLVTAVGDDPAGRSLCGMLSGRVEVVRLPLRGSTVTKTRVRARGQTLLRIDTGDGRPGGVPDAATARRAARLLRNASAVLVSDYGRGVADVLGPFLRDLPVPLVWDPHPRGPAPVPGCALVTPSESEARLLSARPYASPGQTARHLARLLHARAVAVTLGERGAVVAGPGGRFARIPAPACPAGSDACGAGDRFAGAAALALGSGATAEDAVTAGVLEAARFVAAGGAASVRDPAPAVPAVPGDRPRTALEVAGLVRATGGRLIATGGCFDLLHAGHVSLLRRARALGDALIVCVNSDASVRRLKGPGRPVVGEQDRVEVLRALECVDAVAVFTEDTPEALIERLRPDVWVKGGDYDALDLPEAESVRRGGGETVILPQVSGRSTTNLIAAARAAS